MSMTIDKPRLRVIAALLALWLALPVWAETKVTLNLEEANIRALINTVSEATGRNFVVDPRVKAKVTVVSSKPMAEEELYQVFLSILDVHGFAAIPAGDVVKIVPAVNAKQGSIPTVDGGPGGDELVTRIVQVEHVQAAQLVPILRPLVPQQGHLAAYGPTNVLVISDTAANVSRLATIVERIDRAKTSDIEVIPLDHASASEVVRIISSLQQERQRGGAPGPTLAADERTNSVLLSGDQSQRLRIRGIIAHLDTPLEQGGQTRVLFLKYAQAEDLVPVLQGISESQQAKGGDTGGDGIDIQADKANNAVVITAPPDVQRNLASVVRQLDIRRAQVLVEAVVAEVSTDLTEELGVQFAVDGTSGGEDAGPIGLTNFGGSGTSIVQLAQEPLSIGSGAILGIGDLREGRTNFALLVRALAGDAATNILSTPTLVTMDNQEAEIVVGQNVPFVTGQFTTAVSNGGEPGAGTNPFQTIERRDIGLTLKLKPQINEGDTIKLEIEHENSSLAATSQGASDLVTNKRSIDTSVMVENGQLIVLGGLIEDTFKDNVQKIPGLGDIPVLGHLFRFNRTTQTKQNLMVFIHPVILRDPATADAYTSRKYSYLRARQMEADLNERGLLEGAARRFPDLDDLITQLPGPQPQEGSTER